MTAKPDSISDTFWMSVLAGLGGLFSAAILFASVYLFEPAAKMWI